MMTAPTSVSTRSIPALCAGDRLTRDEFERRYAAMPHCKKAELIEGVVYMPSPVSAARHGDPQALLVFWLCHYVLRTPGLRCSDNATVRLDLDNEPQPDVHLRLLPGHGGRTQIGPEGYVEGPPELVVEVTASRASYDLHDKLDVYRRSGVREYLVYRVDDAEVDWFVLTGGRYEAMRGDGNGVLCSVVFPGLWLDVPALLRSDGAALLACLERGLASDEHARFVESQSGQ
jgi:Uma2 family endonuclease